MSPVDPRVEIDHPAGASGIFADYNELHLHSALKLITQLGEYVSLLKTAMESKRKER